MVSLGQVGVFCVSECACALQETPARRLGSVNNLVPGVLVTAAPGSIKKDCKPFAVQVRATIFSRRVIRVRVNPRNEELATLRSVPVQVAREMLNAGHRYLDVRTVEEFAGGHIEGAMNVPYLHKAGAGMTKNHRFVEEVSKLFDKDDEIVVGCLSGRRSLMAAAELQAANFTGVTDMVGGHNAWVESGLHSKFED